MTQLYHLIDKLHLQNKLTRQEYKELLEHQTPELCDYLFEQAREVSLENFQNHIYIRGLIEVSNYCKNDCYYCGIRRSNHLASRYRLSKDEILACCKEGYRLGFRTFVLQGGEDGYYTDARMTDIIEGIRNGYPDCAITLSLGERSYESYEAFYKAGANRYLLRHETACKDHYGKLHPSDLSYENRMNCLNQLKEIGYQVGTGIMVGSPYQTIECLAKDLMFIQEFQPHMVGIGPFISHHQTPFRDRENGTLEQTLFLLGILRLMLPKAMLPATTALGTIYDGGRELGIQAGANVVMPNLSPQSVRKKYLLYDNKICTGSEAAESIESLKENFKKINYEIVIDRGDYHV